jgi:acetate---CoA ligase (ADP-forming)
MFRPGSIALVGATERSIWSNSTYDNLRRFQFTGDIHLVNPKGGIVYDREVATSCRAIGKPVDLALLIVPERFLDDTLIDLNAADIRYAVVLSSGFAETGADGAERQRALVTKASALGITLLGPNCLGFVNFVDKVPAWTGVRRRQRDAGTLAILSQSGAVANNVAEFAFREGITLSYMVSTGNEADIDVAEVLNFLADDAQTQAIALFLESVREPKRFAQAAWRARAAGKRIAVAKVGSSPISAKAAQAHTGALTGDDSVFDAVCRRLGMVRVDSLEELLFTADLLARVPPVEGRRLGFAATSGGMGELAADRADRLGLQMPELSRQTVEAVRKTLPAFGTPHNPLDLTGGALIDVSILENGVRILAEDPSFDVIACLYDAPVSDSDHPITAASMKAIGRALADSPKPAVVFSNMSAAVSAAAREAESDAGLVYSGAGLDTGLAALSGVATWWERHRELCDQGPLENASLETSIRPMGERAVLEYLAARGVPVIPAHVAKTAQEAIEATEGVECMLVLKVASPDIPHKSEAGGVALNVERRNVATRFEQMMADVSAAEPAARIDGILISPMRTQGVELFVGTVNDPTWGPAITVGLGGVFVEVFKDTALRLLPVTRAQVLTMLDELRASAMLDGVRGMPAVDRIAVADVVVSIGDAALALGEDLVSLEVNPLLARGECVEALDGLAIWAND